MQTLHLQCGRFSQAHLQRKFCEPMEALTQTRSMRVHQKYNLKMVNLMKQIFICRLKSKHNSWETMPDKCAFCNGDFETSSIKYSNVEARLLFAPIKNSGYAPGWKHVEIDQWPLSNQYFAPCLFVEISIGKSVHGAQCIFQHSWKKSFPLSWVG